MTFHGSGEVGGERLEPGGRQRQVAALLPHKVVAMDKHQALMVVLAKYKVFYKLKKKLSS